MNRIRTWWQQKNLAHPVQILRRVLALPWVFVFRAALTAAVLLGWGAAAARRVWEDTE